VLGGPVIRTEYYHEKWRAGWDIWKKDICERLTERIDYRSFRDTTDERYDAVEKGNQYFWKSFPLEVDEQVLSPFPGNELPEELQGLLKHTVSHTGVIIDAASTMPKLSRVHTIIEKYLSVMGFNLVQLGLVGDAGFSFIPSVIPNLGQSILSDNDSPLYWPLELASLVSSAASLGVAIMPEITVSTDAAGWVNAGFTLNCPVLFCTGNSLPNNVNEEQLLPVLYSVIGELRSIFNSSKLFHLGTDERSSSMNCWQEAQLTPDFDKFEAKLETLIALANLAPEETLRRENGEGIRYKNRAGGVTQYPTGQLDDIRTDELFFLTVDLFDGDAFTVFTNTKKAVALKPLGVLADLAKLSESKFTNWDIPKRLLAFAMGVSEIANFWSLFDESTFNDYFSQICEALELEVDCSPPVDRTFHVDVVTESKQFIDKQCDVYTRVESILVAKKPVTPWFQNDAAEQ
jgi:Glycosyl hydrolase family 20, catalytic domain